MLPIIVTHDSKYWIVYGSEIWISFMLIKHTNMDHKVVQSNEDMIMIKHPSFDCSCVSIIQVNT
jgi:hypothetical protein